MENIELVEYVEKIKHECEKCKTLILKAFEETKDLDNFEREFSVKFSSYLSLVSNKHLPQTNIVPYEYLKAYIDINDLITDLYQYPLSLIEGHRLEGKHEKDQG